MSRIPSSTSGRPLDRAAILSASAPDDEPDSSERSSRPVTTLDVLEMQVHGVMHACATMLRTIESMQRRPTTPDLDDEPDARPATFGRNRAPETPEADHGTS